jgi:hypothetical protein
VNITPQLTTLEKLMWPEKGLTKSSILAHRLTLWAEGTGDYSTSSWWDNFGEPACTRLPIPPWNAWGQTPWADSPKSCLTGRGNIHCHTTQHTNLKKGQRHWESIFIFIILLSLFLLSSFFSIYCYLSPSSTLSKYQFA